MLGLFPRQRLLPTGERANESPNFPFPQFPRKKEVGIDWRRVTEDVERKEGRKRKDARGIRRRS